MINVRFEALIPVHIENDFHITKNRTNTPAANIKYRALCSFMFPIISSKHFVIVHIVPHPIDVNNKYKMKSHCILSLHLNPRIPNNTVKIQIEIKNSDITLIIFFNFFTP